MGRLPPGGYNLNSEGDRVLNKKKLDELVRQVTGGGEGLEGGESLTAEVEEVRCLSLLALCQHITFEHDD